MRRIKFSKKTIRLLFIVLFSIHVHQLFSQNLVRYSCIVDRVFVDEFEKMKGKSFDKAGIIKQNNRYHPLSIVQYGVLCHNEFLETGDSAYYYKCINQVAYFKDSTKINYLFDGEGIGLPYNFKAHDLRPPWYSGMTQGYAISFLLRYHELTGDNDVLPIIKKIAYLLKLPVEEGGVIGVNKEGYKFIEEYPNSKTHPQVLNGAINGLIGLKEYCDHFPDDTLASLLFVELFDGLKESIPFYDTPDWSTYSRKKQRLTNLYMRYQINEMEQLYNLFRDDFFYNQLLIWSSFAYNKPNKGRLYKRGEFNYSIPLNITSMESFVPLVEIDTVFVFSEQEMNSLLFKRERQLEKYFLKGKIPKRNYSKSRFHLFDLKKDTVIKLMELISLTNNGDFKIRTFQQGKFKMLNYKVIEQNRNTFLIELTEEKRINNFVYHNPKLSDKTNLSQVQYLFNYSEKNLPFFSHFQSKVFNLKKNEKIKIISEYRHAKNMRIFYRISEKERDISKKTWKAKNVLEDVVFEMPKDGYCQFLISFDVENPFFEVKNIETIKCERIFGSAEI